MIIAIRMQQSEFAGGYMSHIYYTQAQLKDRIISEIFVILALSVLIFSGFFVLEEYGILPYLLIFIGTISALIFRHSNTRGYKCTNCGCEFEITFCQDLPTINSILFMKKMLTCPDFKLRDYTIELIKKKSN